jgi:hypothetical protein
MGIDGAGGSRPKSFRAAESLSFSLKYPHTVEAIAFELSPDSIQQTFAESFIGRAQRPLPLLRPPTRCPPDKGVS